MTPPNHDRDAILARRALLISTALAGLACTSSKPSTASTDASGAVDQSEAGQGSGDTQVLAPNKPWAEVMAEAPPMTVPEGLSAREHQQLTSQVQMLERQYAELKSAWDQVPSCAADEDSCEVWAELGETLEPFIDDDSGFPGGCDSASGRTGTLVARMAAHRRFQAALVSQLETYLDGAAAHFGPKSARAWQAKLAEARAPKPMPCLSPCPMPTYSDITAVISFAPGSAELNVERPSPATMIPLDALEQGVLHNRGAQIIIRGHADPSEADPEGLAKQRAEAVAAWLVETGVIEAGVAKDRLETVGLGARLPVERGKAGPAHNPRVDFEVVPPDQQAQPELSP